MKKLLPLLIALLVTSGFTARAQMMTLSAEGTKQGKFKGESKSSKFADRSELTGYLQEGTSPREAGAILATGRRSYQPVLLLKPSGASSPQFFQAMATNELLKKVVIDFYRPDPSGVSVNYYTVTLENVTVSGYKQFIGPLDKERFNPGDNLLYDEIKLSFQKITVEDKDAHTMATDDAGGRL